jgi:PKD repeat protein
MLKAFSALPSRPKLAIFLVFLNLAHLSGQAWDAIWILGQDESVNGTGSGSLLNFNTGELEVSFIQNRYFLDASNTVMSNKAGQLQFYSNGCYVFNANHEIMENGSIVSGYYSDAFCGNFSLDNASRLPQSILALPTYGNDSLYFLISQKLDLRNESDTTTVVGSRLYLNLINMAQKNGLGAITSKFIEIPVDTCHGEYIQAVKHGNGRDWWLIVPIAFSNEYQVVYLRNDGYFSVSKQIAGPHYGVSSWLGQSCFSPDGSMYVRHHWKFGFNLFQFDRCIGLLTFAKTLAVDTSLYFRSGCAFSHSSQFLYATTREKVFQFDLQALDIEGSKTLVGEYDGFNTPYPTRFYLMNLALDGNIYIVSPGQTKHLHVIQEPDSVGIACSLLQHHIELKTSNFWAFPNLSHYRLGHLKDSPCDTLSLNDKPWAFFSYQKVDTSLQNNMIRFKDLSAYAPSTWRWDFGDGTVSMEQNPTHTYSDNGSHNICLKVANAYGDHTFCRTINQASSVMPEIDPEQVEVQVLPTIFSDQLQITNGYDKPFFQFYIYDQFGSLVAVQTIQSNSYLLETSHLAEGVYYWVCKSISNRPTYGKIVKVQ